MNEVTVRQERRVDDIKFTDLSARMDGLAAQHTVLVEGLAENTALTAKIEASTSGLVDAWAALSGGLKVLNFLGAVAKWVGIIAAAFSAVYAAMHMGPGAGSGP